MHGKTPEPRRPPADGWFNSVHFGGEIGTGMRRVPAEFAMRPGASPPKSPNFLGVASQAAWIRVSGLITGTDSAHHDPAVVGRAGDAVIAGTDWIMASPMEHGATAIGGRRLLQLRLPLMQPRQLSP
jgi:hypothetical protein